MVIKSRQRRSEENKTPSLDDLTRIKFRALPPFEGAIEIVNKADMGRVCTICTADFKSPLDAKLYAELLALGPKLLSVFLNDPKQLDQAVKQFEKRILNLKSKQLIKEKKGLSPQRSKRF